MVRQSIKHFANLTVLFIRKDITIKRIVIIKTTRQ